MGKIFFPYFFDALHQNIAIVIVIVKAINSFLSEEELDCYYKEPNIPVTLKTMEKSFTLRSSLVNIRKSAENFGFIDLLIKETFWEFFILCSTGLSHKLSEKNLM